MSSGLVAPKTLPRCNELAIHNDRDKTLRRDRVLAGVKDGDVGADRCRLSTTDGNLPPHIVHIMVTQAAPRLVSREHLNCL